MQDTHTHSIEYLIVRAHEHLMRHGNLAVPCSRYGRDTVECAETAIAYVLYVTEDAEELTDDFAEAIMGYAVNDSDVLDGFEAGGEFGGYRDRANAILARGASA